MEQRELFDQLYKLDVNDRTEKKNGLTYLSWAWAWAEFKKACPDAVYEVVKQENGLPYVIDETGAMVFTKVTACGVTHEMWLPVMDFKNKAIPADVVTMTDINKAIMRCLTKNLAMFGLGLYIYAGEDLPEDADQKPAEKAKPADNPAEEVIKCIQCGEEIKPAKNGAKTLSARDFAAKSGNRCMKCFRQARVAEMKEAEK
jgi:hypothetical protein